MNKDTGLKVLYVASEVSPYAKTGGLADVAGSLPKALRALGHDVRVVMPRYQVIKESMETICDFPVNINDRKETAIIRTAIMDSADGDDKSQPGVRVYFVDNYQYFDRVHLYVHADEAERYAFFCRAVLEMLTGLDFKPDLIHCNDWQAGPICPLLREKAKTDSFYEDIATVMTVHNLHYQGNYPREALGYLGLSDYFFDPERLEFYGQVSFMKAGLVYADVINTVSRTYAEEIKTPKFGEGLEGILRLRAGDLFGIVNGIDYNVYNPSKDNMLVKNYDTENLTFKRENKLALQKAMSLPEKDVPVIGLISRLVNQKGLDLVVEAFDSLMRKDLQFILLGSGDSYYEDYFRTMQKAYPDKLAAFIGFNEALAKQIYAGADLFLMPSRFEPCGLGQLMALRYGTIPVVRATGGLADTVTDYDPVKGTGNGFVFSDYRSEKMMQAINRALRTYTTKEAWWELVSQAMLTDFSWDKSALEYERIYKLALEKHLGNS